MALSISNTPKNKGGRPRTDATPVMVRLQPSDLAALDAYIAQQAEPLTRPEAIRQLIRAGLSKTSD